MFNYRVTHQRDASPKRELLHVLDGLLPATIVRLRSVDPDHLDFKRRTTSNLSVERVAVHHSGHRRRKPVLSCARAARPPATNRHNATSSEKRAPTNIATTIPCPAEPPLRPRGTGSAGRGGSDQVAVPRSPLRQDEPLIL